MVNALVGLAWRHRFSKVSEEWRLLSDRSKNQVMGDHKNPLDKVFDPRARGYSTIPPSAIPETLPPNSPSQ
jgi:hypothetical protein